MDDIALLTYSARIKLKGSIKHLDGAINKMLVDGGVNPRDKQNGIGLVPI